MLCDDKEARLVAKSGRKHRAKQRAERRASELESLVASQRRDADSEHGKLETMRRYGENGTRRFLMDKGY